jgi:hypothetical protein
MIDPVKSKSRRITICCMTADFNAVFNTLKHVTKSSSLFPQHNGQPMWFGAVKKGKAYVRL